MNNFILSARVKLSLTIFLILSTFFISTVSALSEESKKITEINIVTPEFKDQTNKDGSGLFFDLIRKVYEPSGIKMTYEIMPWKRAEMMISQKKADAMLCARKLKERLTTKYPMFVEHTAVIFRKDNIKNWIGFDTLKDKNVVWIRGYDFHLDMRLKHLNMNWHEVDTHDQVWKLINAGRYDFYMDALIDMEMYIKHNKVDMSLFQTEIIWSDNAYMSFAKTEKSNDLIDIYDRRIIELFNSGELEKLFKKWDTQFSAEAWENK